MKTTLHYLRGAFVFACVLGFVWFASPMLAGLLFACFLWAELGAAWNAYQWKHGPYKSFRGKFWRYGSAGPGGFSFRCGKLTVGVRIELFRLHFWDWFHGYTWTAFEADKRTNRFALPLMFRITSFALPRHCWLGALWRVYYGPIDVIWDRCYRAQCDSRYRMPQTFAGKLALALT